MESSTLEDSITGQPLPQSLPYDIFDSPDEPDYTNERFQFAQTLPGFGSFPRPPLPLSSDGSIISLHSADFAPAAPAPTTELRPVTDFTLVEYFIHEMPDLPIFFERFRQQIHDILSSFVNFVVRIPHTDWRKVLASSWNLLIDSMMSLRNLGIEGVTALSQISWEHATANIQETTSSLRSWFAEWADDIHYRFFAGLFGNGYRAF